MVNQSLKNSNIIIASHVFTTGPPQDLEDYLKNKVECLMFIGHPLPASKETHSFYKLRLNGKIEKENKGLGLKSPQIICHAKDLAYTVFWVLKSKRKFDIFFGVDPLNCLAGIFLQKIRRTQRVVLYTIDYVPRRFNNNLINHLYHLIDSYCVNQSNQIWNLSDRMAFERENKNVLKDDRQIVVPIGVNFERIERVPEEKIDRKCLVYMGHLRKGQGLELILETFPSVVKEIPDVKLVIIGTGELENNLKKRSEELGVSNNIEFRGLVKDHREVEKMLSKCSVGLAIYEPSPDSITQYTDPSKPKQYMSCGLPIIITDVPWIAKQIKKDRMGLIVKYNKESLKDAMIALLTNDDLYFDCRKNAINFSSTISWNQIFDRAVSKALIS